LTAVEKRVATAFIAVNLGLLLFTGASPIAISICIILGKTVAASQSFVITAKVAAALNQHYVHMALMKLGWTMKIKAGATVYGWKAMLAWNFALEWLWKGIHFTSVPAASLIMGKRKALELSNDFHSNFFLGGWKHAVMKPCHCSVKHMRDNNLLEVKYACIVKETHGKDVKDTCTPLKFFAKNLGCYAGWFGKPSESLCKNPYLKKKSNDSNLRHYY